ncbi:MAG: Flp pilus assembly protein CpaB [Stellaceae bacterium]
MILRNILLGLGVLAMIAGVALGVIWLREPAPQQVADQGQQQQPATPRQSILVTNRAITTGTLLTATDMRWKELPANQTPPVDAMLRGQISEADFVGSVSRRGFGAGDPLTQSDLVKPNQGGFLAAVLAPAMRAVSVTVGAAESVAGLVAPGDRVDVILTQTFNDTLVSAPRKSVGETVLHDVRVIAVDQALSGAIQAKQQPAPATAGVEGRIPRTVTLEVTEQQAEKLLVAMNLGKIELSMRPFSPPGTELPIVEGAATPTPTWASDVSPALKSVDRGAPNMINGKPAPVPAIAVMRGSKTERLCPGSEGLTSCSEGGAGGSIPAGQQARSE